MGWRKINILLYMLSLFILWIYGFFLEDLIKPKNPIFQPKKQQEVEFLTKRSFKQFVDDFKIWFDDFTKVWEFEIIWIGLAFMDPILSFWWSLWVFFIEIYKIYKEPIDSWIESFRLAWTLSFEEIFKKIEEEKAELEKQKLQKEELPKEELPKEEKQLPPGVIRRPKNR